VRAIVLDRDRRLLLLSYLDATVHGRARGPHASPVWIAPGGGLRVGEEPAAALQREVVEETGLVGVDWGAWLWRRTIDLRFEGRWRRFEELYRWGRLPVAEPAAIPTALDAHEHAALLGYRWWTLEELRATRDPVYPPRLAARLDAVCRAGAPATPIDISGDG
jgi:8-oxo-dGTP pyrophosphatase MutT (NUDIX family)